MIPPFTELIELVIRIMKIVIHRNASMVMAQMKRGETSQRKIQFEMIRSERRHYLVVYS